MTGENLTGNILLGYAYQKSTFSTQEKVLIAMFAVSVYGLICAMMLGNGRFFNFIKCISVFMFLTSVLAWNYMYSSMDNQNDNFGNFQNDSEGLVTSVIVAGHKGVEFDASRSNYGLGSLSPQGKLGFYRSQYGLQGKVFRHMARYMDYQSVTDNLHLICSMATATVFVLIVFLVSVKYNKLFAGCFFVTFWLSPWIVNFARNLYWVEFTWFLPMAIGLFCAWKINDRRCRVASYIAVFVAIMAKSLCGYEYVSSIMMGIVVFLAADFVAALAGGDKKRQMLILRTTFILGVMAICGFMVAICIHASLRGDGNIAEGIKNIFEQDVLRRTYGADFSDFPPVYWDSFNASAWEVFCEYFHFSTQVITGIDGNMFPLLCIISLVIFVYDYKMNKLNVGLLSIYVFSFLSSVSWLLLAKSHSYIHTHMNYVLWYMSYVPVCFYVIADCVVNRNIRKCLTK